MDVYFSRSTDNKAFLWVGEWPEYDDCRFPDLILCIQGDTLLPQLCFYIAAKWHIHPGCVEFDIGLTGDGFFIGDEGDRFTQASVDMCLADVPIPPSYNELFVTVRLQAIPTCTMSLPLRWEVHRDDDTGVDTLHYRVDALRCWGCGGCFAEDIEGASLLRCGHTHCARCTKEIQLPTGFQTRTTRCKYCQHASSPFAHAPSKVLKQCRAAVTCSYVGCEEIAVHRCWCSTLLCGQHNSQHCNQLKGHHSRLVANPTDAPTRCYHAALHESGQRTLYCTKHKDYMCHYCLTDVQHTACPAGSHVEVSTATAQKAVLEAAEKSRVRIACCNALLDEQRRKLSPPFEGLIPHTFNLREATLSLVLRPVIASVNGFATATSGVVDFYPFAHCRFPRRSTGETSAHLAASNGHAACLEVLLATGVDMQAQDRRAKTPAHHAAEKGHAACLEVLRQAGVDMQAKDDDGKTPAHHAAENGNSLCLRLLLACDCDMQARDWLGKSPAHFAAANGRSCCLNILRWANVDLSTKDKLGTTPAHVAAANGHFTCLEVLHQAGVDMQAKDELAKTPVHLAAEMGNLACLEVLSDAGVDARAKDAKEWTPAHYAAANGHAKCLAVLRAEVLSMNAQNAYGKTPAHLASEKGHAACLEVLHASGANMEARDKYEKTPAHFAGEHGHPACLEVLRAAGANLDAKDWKGRTAAQFSKENDHPACLEVLAAVRGS